MAYGKVQLPPETTEDPIAPLYPLPPKNYVQTPLRNMWRFFREYEPAHSGGTQLGQAADRILNEYFLPNQQWYPIGTMLPVNIFGKDYLFVFDWHDKPAPWHPSVTAYVPKDETLKKLLGRWLVTFDTGWSWFYTLRPGHIAVSTDIKNPPEQEWYGKWSFISKSVKIQWRTSTEEWFLPLDVTQGVRGQSLLDYRGLTAEKKWGG